MNFVVTGASGFIGRVLCEQLVKQGHAVQPYDRNASAEKRYAKGLVCVHLAGVSIPSEAERRPQQVEAEALEFADRLLDQNFVRLVFASSALVYGDRVNGARKEMDPVSPQGAYARMKRAVEEKVLEKNQTVARIANSYGQGMRAPNIFSDVLKQIPGSGPLIVENEAPIRDFIHISDVVRGLIAIALGKQNGVFNLGTGVGTSVQSLVKQLLKRSGETSREVVSRKKLQPLSSLVLDPFKTRECFEWQAGVDLKQGLGLLGGA